MTKTNTTRHFCLINYKIYMQCLRVNCPSHIWRQVPSRAVVPQLMSWGPLTRVLQKGRMKRVKASEDCAAHEQLITSSHGSSASLCMLVCWLLAIQPLLAYMSLIVHLSQDYIGWHRYTSSASGFHWKQMMDNCQPESILV